MARNLCFLSRLQIGYISRDFPKRQWMPGRLAIREWRSAERNGPIAVHAVLIHISETRFGVASGSV
jgi:hypothetical protein